MSGRRVKADRRQKKIKAKRFAKELDSTQIKIWLKHKQANPHVKCNSEFQEKVEKWIIQTFS